MTNEALLRDAIDKNGAKITWLCEKTGISREAFYRKMRGDSEFKASEIMSICDLLHISERDRTRIFFAK